MLDLKETCKPYFSSANFIRFMFAFPSKHKTFNYIRKQLLKILLFFQ